MPVSWRRVRQYFKHFSIDSPRMSVRSHLPWPWRVVAGVALLAIVGGMWWWGFDFGQIFGGFNRKEVEAKLTVLESEAARLRAEAVLLRAKNSQQESELAMTQGAQATLSKQALELLNENTQLKEELIFLQKLVADSNKQVGLTIQRLVVERERDDAFHYSLLVVRGGNPRDEFDGTLTLQAAVHAAAAAGLAPRQTILSLPEEQPETAPALKLKFKYYQRVEGTIRVPPGAQVRSVTVRAFEAGQASPRATRTLVIQEPVRQ
jgi:hypothetical protein